MQSRFVAPAALLAALIVQTAHARIVIDDFEHASPVDLTEAGSEAVLYEQFGLPGPWSNRQIWLKGETTPTTATITNNAGDDQLVLNLSGPRDLTIGWTARVLYGDKDAPGNPSYDFSANGGFYIKLAQDPGNVAVLGVHMVFRTGSSLGGYFRRMDGSGYYEFRPDFSPDYYLSNVHTFGFLFDIDDTEAHTIVIEEIGVLPEPAVATLLLPGAVLALARRRRRAA